MKPIRSLTALLLSGFTIAALAVPAKRGLFPVTQPDGSVVMVQRIGDEHMHFTLTPDRHILTTDNLGFLTYGHVDTDGMIQTTGVRANASLSDAAKVKQSYDLLPIKALKARRQEIKTARSRAIAQTGMGRFSGNFPRTGKVKGLVILVEYKDVKFTMNDPYSYFNDMLNKEGFDEYGGTGSARDYFLQNSNGLFDPEFDIYGPYTLPNNREYYGGNNHYGEDQAPEEMIIEACRGLNSRINFADYDMDGDGWVDNVFVFYAGQGEASGGPDDSVWPHQWELTEAGKEITLDGKKISKYACSNEWEDGRPDGVGTFIHEFSHVMGLPDLYETSDDGESVTPGEWSVLDYGPYNNDGRTPPNYSIFERNAMGWCEPQVLDGPATITLDNFADTNNGCIIPTTEETEFFLLENRQQEGWDTYLPGHGMLIWHVDFVQSVWDSNAVNNTPSHMYVELEKADGPVQYETIKYKDEYYYFPIVDGWSFPGKSGNTSFTNSTTPSMKTWNGTDIDMPITGITESQDGIITFDVAGGLHIAAPVLAAPENINGNGFDLSWLPVDDATDYLVTVTYGRGGAETIENYDSKTLPNGWTKSSGIDTYTSADNYKTAGKSLKFSASNHTLSTRTYDDDVTYLSFWHKGQNTSNSFMTINGLIDNKWVKISTVTPIKNTADTFESTAIPPHVKAIQLVYTKSTGNMAVDDITVKTGGKTDVTVDGYDRMSTAGETSHHFDLSRFIATLQPDDHRTFTVTVRSTDGTDTSTGASCTVTLLDQAGIEDVTIDNAPVEYYNLQGIRVTDPQHGQIYIRHQPGKPARLVRL